jgi:3-hydroxyisobutyrate dehydrogenase
MIAFFGMGLLGSGFVRALRQRGEDVHVWNRSPAKAKALEAYGARAFESPADAVRGAARVHLTLSDDAAVDETLERARPGFDPSLRVVDHTTTTKTGAAARAARWAERGVPFVHAPVFMGPENALKSTGLMLVSGPRELVDPVRPELAKMTGTLHDLGPRPETAAAFKLLGNLFLMFLTTGMADVLALAKALGVPSADAAGLFDLFNPGASLPARMKRMLEARYDEPSWALSMARKDTRLMLEEAERSAVPLAVLPAIAARMDAVIAEGHGARDWSVLAKDALSGP